MAWLTCIETMFSQFKQVTLLGEDVALVGFDLSRQSVVAVCHKGKRKVHVTLDSIEFRDLKPVERLWLRAWRDLCASGLIEFTPSRNMPCPDAYGPAHIDKN